MNTKRRSIVFVLSALLAGQLCAQTTGTISPSFPGTRPGGAAGTSALESTTGRAGLNGMTGTMPVGSGSFGGSVPERAVTADAISLTLSDAVARGLRNNLGLLLTQQGARIAEGRLGEQRSALLPNLKAKTTETVQQTNLAAFGFSGFPGVSSIVGPFSVFDARVSMEQRLLDLAAIQRFRAAEQGNKAAGLSLRDARELVVFAVANLYFRAAAAESRVQTAHSQLETADAILRQATDFKSAGVVPAIEVLRAQVEQQAQQQRLIVADNDRQKTMLALARAIGLPIAQEFRLADTLSDAVPPAIEPSRLLEQAYSSRPDFQRLQAQVSEAEKNRSAAEAQRLPRLVIHGDYGDIGRSIGQSHGTFAAAASLELPLFEGGRIGADVMQADALLNSRRAELENLRAEVEHDLQVTLLDLKAAEQVVTVARSARDLAGQQMTQAQDRFAAGVASNIEVVQAQEALAAASENYTSSLYSLNVAKVSLARAAGIGEANLAAVLQGEWK